MSEKDSGFMPLLTESESGRGSQQPAPSGRDHVTVLEQKFGEGIRARKVSFRGSERTLSKRRGLARKVFVGKTRAGGSYLVKITTGDDTVLKFGLSREAMEALAEQYDELNGMKRGVGFWKLLVRAVDKPSKDGDAKLSSTLDTDKQRP